jgi:flagellar motility protein MotE (MotC chaperone)
MAGGKTGSKLLSLALCTLIALLVLKLGLTVMGVLHATPEVRLAVPVAMAREESPPKPVNKHEPKSAAPAAPGKAQSAADLQQQADQIHKQQEELKEEQKQLEKLKKDVQEKLDKLIALQKQVMQAQGRKKSDKSSQVQGLAKIYSTMKPKQAAVLMGSLDDNLVKSIISTMTPDKAASILALMDVKKAAKISEALSGQ